MAGTPLHVRGTCPKCRHVLDTTAPTGRATWRGQCPAPKCDGSIIARRVKADPTPAAPEPEPPVQPPQRGRQRKRPIRAGEYVRPVEVPESEVPGDDPVDSEPAEPVAQPGREPDEPRREPARPRVPEQRRHVGPYDWY